MKRSWLGYIAIATITLSILATPFAVLGEDKKADAPKAEKKPANAAIVNGVAISYGEFERELNLYSRRLQGQGMQIPENLQGQVNQEVINELISRELMYQEARKLKVEPEKDFAKNEIDAIKKRFPDPQQYEAMLSNINMTEPMLAEQLTRISYIRALVDKEVTSKVEISDEDAKKFYDENPQYFNRPEEIHAQHILIKLDKDADEKKKTDARKTLLDLKKRAESGEDFGELAKQYSQGPSGPKGGDLGFFSKGKMVPPFEMAAFALKPGEISDIVETRFGYHLIKLVERKDAQTASFEDVKPKIVENLRRRKAQEEAVKYVNKLREKAKVEVFIN